MIIDNINENKIIKKDENKSKDKIIIRMKQIYKKPKKNKKLDI